MPAAAENYRIATFGAALSRDGPGLLLRDLRKGNDPQIAASVAIIAHIAPDVLLLTDFDYDLDGLALSAFSQTLRAAGIDYPYQFASQPNTGLQTGFDLDGDGRLGQARDAQGYGRFAGDGGMAILSRVPLGGVTDLSAMLWQDMEGAQLPFIAGTPFPDLATQAVQRLSHTAHWVVSVNPKGFDPFHLLAWAATPPVFDGPEDRNGLRNRDELRVWENLLNTAPPADFIVIGNANLDPNDGDGLRLAMAAFLGRSDLRDPQPQSAGGRAAADPDHTGNPALDTADWPDGAPGNLRVSYVLPAATWTIVDAGVFWPAKGDPDVPLLGLDGLGAGPHRLTWVDISR